MAVLSVYEPQFVSRSGLAGIGTKQGLPDESAAFRTGDFVGPVTTGTIVNPASSGAGLTTAGPLLGANAPFNITSSSYSLTQGVVTVTATASSAPGIPLQWFCVVSYSSNGVSLPSVPFLINAPAGLLPVVSVSATGEPSGFTTFDLYTSNLPNTFWKQGSSTATGSTVTPAYPLTNRVGINKLAANFTTNCFGLAGTDSDAVYYAGVGPGLGKRAILGPTQSVPPGWDGYALTVPCTDLGLGYVELNLIQAWYPSLLYASVGFAIDANTGFFVADTAGSAAATIQGKPFGPNKGDVADTYARVVVKLNASVLI